MSTETLPAAVAEAPDEGSAPPRVVLLNDSRFFVRSLPVSATATAAEIAAQVELALETLSPFPVSQLYHGHLWKPGSGHALVFAAYRRRFTAEETESWSTADLVVPSFVTAASLALETGATVIVSANDAMTAVYWGEPGPIPSRVATEPLPGEAGPDERAGIRDGLLRTVGGKGVVMELDPPVAIGGNPDSRDHAFLASGRTLRLAAADTEAIDVRDKVELAARRRARARDTALWRTFVGLLALLILAAVGEGVLVGLRAWQKARQGLLDERQPQVERIMAQQTLATRIEELSTKRLKPFEMITLVTVGGNPGTQKPVSIQFVRTANSGLYTLEIEAQTKVGGDLSLYQAALRNNPTVASVEVTKQDVRDATTTFVLVVTFKPEALASPAAGANP